MLASTAWLHSNLRHPSYVTSIANRGICSISRSRNSGAFISRNIGSPGIALRTRQGPVGNSSMSLSTTPLASLFPMRAAAALAGPCWRPCATTARSASVLTDNGARYKSRRFSFLCQRLGLRHVRTKPYTPQTNGKAERFIQTALRESAYARSYESSSHRAQHLPFWLHHYNWHRPHASLQYQPPISRITGLNNLVGLHS